MIKENVKHCDGDNDKLEESETVEGGDIEHEQVWKCKSQSAKVNSIT